MADAPNTVVATITKTVAQGFVPTIKVSTTILTAVLVHHGEKSKKFNRLNFKIW